MTIKQLWAGKTGALTGLTLAVIPVFWFLAGLLTNLKNQPYFDPAWITMMAISLIYSSARWLWIQRSLKTLRREAAARAELITNINNAHHRLANKDTK